MRLAMLRLGVLSILFALAPAVALSQSFPVRPGLWPATDEETTGEDLDGDGIPQSLELQLAQHFFPTIWYDSGEDTSAPGGNHDHREHNQPGRLAFRVRPHPDRSDHIAITYALLYRVDGGENFIFPADFGCHQGDVEAFAISLKPDASCALGYSIESFKTFAHDGTFAEHVRERTVSGCNWGFSAAPVTREFALLASENKHGNYLTESECDAGLGGFENCDYDWTAGDVNSWVGINVGESEPETARRHMDLSPLGFSNRLWANESFCGGPHSFSDLAQLACIPLSLCPGPVESKFTDTFVASITSDTPPPAPIGTPSPLSPWFVTISTASPAFIWEVASHAESYDLSVTNEAGEAVLAENYAASTICDAAQCSVTPALSLSDGVYNWTVTGRNGSDTGPTGPVVTFTVSGASSDPSGTPAGVNVSVDLGPVTATFELVVTAGTTTVQTIDPASAGSLPDGYSVFQNMAFDVSTTAEYSNQVTLTFAMPDMPSDEFERLRVFHRQSDQLVDRTSDSEFALRTVSARVSSLSPFVIASGPAPPPADTTAPNISCGSPDGLWHATDVSITCTASDTESGLALPETASFTLQTNVPVGTETSDAQTSSRLICDRVGNCATAGPIGGNKVDKKPPEITLTSPSSGAIYIIAQPVQASYECTDGGSGVKTCSGTVANGAVIDTRTVGYKTFSVSATDEVGNASSVTVTYIVTYAICPQFDQEKEHNSGSAVPVRIQICDFFGTNLSSAMIEVTAEAIVHVTSNTSYPPQDEGNSSPGGVFRHVGGTGPEAGYLFNVMTKDLPAGQYRFRFSVTEDPIIHDVRFILR